MIAALDNFGNVFWALLQCNTTSETKLLFIDELIKLLYKEDRDFKRKTVFFQDNAPYNTSDMTKEYMRKKGLTVLKSAPYSYESCPCELFWAIFKSVDLNPNRKPTGLR